MEDGSTSAMVLAGRLRYTNKMELFKNIDTSFHTPLYYLLMVTSTIQYRSRLSFDSICTA